jgi:hypothetical protein
MCFPHSAHNFTQTKMLPDLVRFRAGPRGWPALVPFLVSWSLSLGQGAFLRK